MIEKKLRSSQGFTLVELVVTTLIMVLVAMTVSVGIRGASNAYTLSLFVSEGDQLSNNLEAALGDVLHYAEYTKTDGDKVRFNSFAYGMEDGYFYLDDGILCYSAAGMAPADGAQLINGNSYHKQRIDNFTITYDVDEMLYSGTYVLKEIRRNELTREYKFYFRTLKDAKQSETP